MERTRAGGRFSNAPDTKQQRDLAETYARDVPMLLLFRQEVSKVPRMDRPGLLVARAGSAT